jgi:hypothetical protein
MRTLDELINTAEPGIDVIREFLESAELPWELLPASDRRGEVLTAVQVTTRSTLGAMAYDTGGLLVDHGWLRVLGSGHPRLQRDLAAWNKDRSDGFYLVADDAVGGFFAINGGGLGPDIQNMYYWPPDDIDWEPLEIGYTDFLQWSLTSGLTDFYAGLRWPKWQEDIKALTGDQCFTYYPFLWAKEGSVETSHRERIEIGKEFDFRICTFDQLRNASTSNLGQMA